MSFTLNDLLDFCSNKKKSVHFSSEQEGEPIVVQVEGTVKFEKNDDTEGLTAVTLQACHTEQNLNKSSISYEVMNDILLPSFKNRPILGYIHEDSDGKPQFYGHNMHINEETDEIVYDEIAVGIIPETNNARLEYDEENDRYNVIVDGYIFDSYTKAKEIVEREGECSCSVEIAIRSMKYEAKEKCLVIEDGYFSGVTLLGYDDNGNKVKPGMAGSNIKLKDFSETNNSMFSEINENEQNKIMKMLEQLNTKLDNLSNTTVPNIKDDYSKEGGNDVKFKELLAKYNKTKEDITFEYENLSDEELEIKFTEVFGEAEPISDGEGGEDTADGTDNTDGTQTDGEGTDDSTTTQDGNDTGETTPVTEQNSENPSKYSVTLSNGTVKEFALSLDEIDNALYTLVNKTYGETDDAYYNVQVYEDNTLVMIDWWNNKAFRQTYSRENNSFSLMGDRVAVNQIWVTEDEEKTLNEMKANYSSIEAELNVYKEAEEISDKMTVFEDKAYANYLETEEFKNLRKEEILKKYTTDELIEKADAALGKVVKTTKNFSFSEEKPAPTRPTMFAFGAQTKDSTFLDGLLKKK